MKKRMISLCIMLTAMTVSMRAGVKIDATHFPDANFRKCLSAQFNSSVDAYPVTTAEYSAQTIHIS